jgi:hypothetical protein
MAIEGDDIETQISQLPKEYASWSRSADQRTMELIRKSDGAVLDRRTVGDYSDLDLAKIGLSFIPGAGTILAVASAIGETAPLLLIGMVAFIVDIPTGFFESATVLPVQIYLWSDLPERAFEARTAAAIVVLLVIMLMLNALAIYLRKKFERRW